MPMIPAISMIRPSAPTPRMTPPSCWRLMSERLKPPSSAFFAPDFALWAVSGGAAGVHSRTWLGLVAETVTYPTPSTV
jgi:hypothetical protein